MSATEIERERVNDKWVAAKYGPKTIGVGHPRRPAFLLIRPGTYQDIKDVEEDVIRLLTAANAVLGVPTEALAAGLIQEAIKTLHELCTAIAAEYATGSETSALLDKAERLLAKLKTSTNQKGDQQ